MNMSKKLKFQGSTKEDGFKNRKETFIVNESVTSNLKTVSENNHITLSALIQTAWGVVLQKYNNVNDVVFGAVISGRQCKVEGIERMVGLCINAIPLRVKGENDTNFITLAKQINNDVIKANTSYGYSSLADIQALTKMKGKLINHILVYENYPMDESLKSFNNKSHAELQVTDMEVFEQTNYDFGIVIIPGEKIKIEITYNNYVYNEEIIDFMGRNLCHTLLQVANDPVCKLGEISVVNEEEKNKVLNEFNKQTPHYPVNKSIQELFQERVEKAPNDVALVFENKELTYKELNEKANKLARLLIEKGIGKNSIIALMVEPSDYLIIGILGILKTGSAFLPIDNEIPKSRIEHILKDSQASMILSNSNLFEDGETYIEYLDVTDESLYAKQGSKNLETHYDLESEVYVIYTSGTSGVPKGVSIKHKSLINYVLWACEQLKLDSVSRSLVTSKYSFDLCYTSIFPILMCGGQIHIINKGIYLDPISLIKYIEMKKISYLKITPTLFSTLMDYSHLLKSCVDLNIIILGGENINISNVKKIAEECPWIAFINHYGPTECTIGCIAHYIDLAQIQHCESYNKIGKPINNTKIYIVNSLNDIVPIGVVGEICVSGMGLAKGYYNNHNLTNEKFIDNPFDKGTKMYKTGDLGRWLPDGHIEYLGRIDNQVKIRGFRVETGEIENHLLKLDGIKEAIVVDKIDENESTYLCAYVTTEKEVIVNTLKKELVQLLPGYMIPSFIIKIDELPITPNGKIDRKALPDPDLSYVTESQYEGPRNDVEEKLVTIWEKLLGRERIGINNDFFDLGGHSLKAAFTISHIRKELGVEVRIKELLENSTIKQLSELIQKKDKKHYTIINKAENKKYYKASSAEKRMFALWETDKNSIVYNLPIMFELTEELDICKVEEVLNEIVRRHEALRTSFHVVDGELVQRVHDKWNLEFNHKKLQKKEALLYMKKFIKPFDLTLAPLIRCSLITYENKNIILLDVHHIAADGVSVGLIRKEFKKLYKGEKLEKAVLQYKDYSEWQIDSLNQETSIKQEQYWLNRLSGELPILNIQTDYERPRVKSFEGSRINFTLDKMLTTKLRTIAKETGTTLYMVLLAVYNVMLAKYSNQEDIIVGTAESGRSYADLENTVGMFVNTVALRNFPESHKTFREFLEEVKYNTLKDFDNTDYQFENLTQKLALKRDASRNPLFDVMFTFESMDYGFSGDEEIDELKLLESEINISKFDLTLTAIEVNEHITFNLEYCSKLFKRETVERMGEHYTNLLHNVVSNLEVALCRLEMIGAKEKDKLLNVFNDSVVEYPKDKTIHQLFEEQVEKTPEHIAVVCDNEKLTYRELNEKSNSLARVLIKNGVKKESIVGVLAEKSLEMIVGILGILKAGGAYLPIDPEYPNDRISYMLGDSGASILLVKDQLAKDIKYSGKVINLKNYSLYEQEKSNLMNSNQPHQLAYVIYTSGTTGAPKGVMVKHKGVVNYIYWAKKSYVDNGTFNFPLYSSIAFDLTVTSLYIPLITGNKIVIYEGGDKALLIRRIIEENKIDIIKLTPTHLRLLENMDLSKSKIKKLIVGGEELKVEQAEKVYRAFNGSIDIYNEYGPTEATVGCMIYKYNAEKDKGISVSIGVPAGNTKLYVLGKNMELLPIGVAGELCVSGDGLASGYINREELTAMKFVENPFEPNNKMYKTGDLVKWMPDGNVEYLGRIDNQVKIRGYRIEIGEIENRLLKIKDVKEAVVIAKKDQNENVFLCSYITSNKKVRISKIKEKLIRELPMYMVPSYIIQIDKIPLSSNGKIDTMALPVIDVTELIESKYEEPRDKIEEILVKVWEKILGIDRIGINYNYYEIGGDSIKSILIVSELRKYHLRLEIKDLMQFPRIKELREHVKLDDTQVNQSAVEGKADLVPIQKWFIEQEFSQENHYNQAFMFYKQDGIDEKVLRKVFLEIVKHHDALRMMYIKENNEFKQWNRGIEQAEEAFSLNLYDLREEENPERNIEMLSSEIQKGMSLEDGILIKLGLFKTKIGDHLLVAIHHIVIDGLSWRILLEDLETLYLKIENEEEVKLPQKTTSFKEWAQKLNEFAKGKEIQKELVFWKKIDETPFETLPKDFSECDILSKEGEEISISFTREQTEKLLRKTNAAYNTHINDILLCSLGLAVNKWCGIDKVCVSLEGHGREDILKDISINRTIGWFTSLYPVTLDMSYSDNLSYSIKLTKEILRHIPNKGIGYGILKYLSNVEKGSHFKLKPEISFNYLGEFGQEESEGLFRYSNIPTGISISRENKKLHSIEINGLVIEGQLRFIFNYNAKEYKRKTIEKFANIYKKSLSEVIDHCENKKVAEKTPWDYGDPDLDLEDLKKITACGKEIEKIHSLSPMQEGMLYNSIIENDSSAYLEQSELTVEGTIDVEILNSILNKIIEKYEILRTVFFYENISLFKQAVLRKRKIKIHYEDISHWDIETKENYIEHFKIRDRDNRFQLTKDVLIRVSVIKVQNNIFKIIYSFHHIIMDGWSIGIILKEIMDNYKAAVKGRELPIEKTVSYSRYLKWLDQKDKLVALEYWENYLHAYEQEIVFPEQQLKVDKYKRRQERISLTENITAKLKNLAEANSITLSSIIQTAWGVLLQKYNNTNDVVFGSVVSGRSSEIDGIENMVGLFINTVPIRVRTKDTTSFIELAKKINKDFIEANTYSYCSLAEVQTLTNMKNKLINHVVIYENYPLDMNLASFHSDYESELKITDTSGFEQTNYDLELLIIPGNELNMKITYNNNIYSKDVISAILYNLINILKNLSFDWEVKVSDIDMVSGVERNKLLREFNDTEVIYSKEKTIQELFEEQVERTPTAVALEFNGEPLTYNELNKKANKLARILRRNYVKENTVVPILIRRSCNLIVGILGILKAGGCYLPLDPEYPVDRIDYMLEDSKGNLLLTEGNLSKHLSFTGPIINIDSQELEHQMDSNIGKINAAEDLAYVIYTSGSTGKPKGVAIEHRAFHNFIKGITERIDFTYNNVILSVTTCSFDIFGLETILPLIKGLKVVIANEMEQKDPYLLNKVIINSEVNTIQLTPSRLKLMLNSSNSKECFQKLNLIMVGGEAFPDDLLYQLKEYTNSKIYNMYGPTETTIWSTIKDLTKENSINIGKPIANTHVYIIDDVGNTVPIGSVGELCIAGDGLARGYLNREELTVKRFVKNPFVNIGKMYKTGDLAKWLPGGEIDIVGRMDDQVKIRGYRIELGEIEIVANQYGKIKECIAVGKTNSFGEQELVLYYVAEEKINTSELIKYLSSMLPTYMIPQIYMEIDEIPLTTNGKLNRKALPEPTQNRPQLNSDYEEVVTDVQRNIRDIWNSILGIEKIGIHDNFFEAGGNSIKIVAMHNEIKKLYPKKIQITDIFAHPTIYRLAQFIESIEKFEELSTPVAQDIMPIELPLEYFWLEDYLNEEPLLKFKLTEYEYSGLLGICGDNYEIYHLLLACYVFLLADTCGKNLVTIQLDNQGEEQISQLSVDISDIENFYDIIRIIKDKIESVKKSQQYSINSLSEVFDSVIDHCIFPLFRVSNNPNVNYLRFYDLVFEIYEGHSEVEIICTYNDQKLNQSKIKDLFYKYIELIRAITKSTVSGSI